MFMCIITLAIYSVVIPEFLVTLYFDSHFRRSSLDVLLIISNLSTTCQLTVIRVLVYYSRLSVNC